MKNFRITFTEKTKYNALTRSISVIAQNEVHARQLFTILYTAKEVSVDKVEEFVKEDKE